MTDVSDPEIGGSAKPQRRAAAWGLVGVVVALLAYTAIASAPLVEGEFRKVRSSDLTQVNFLRAGGDPNDVIRGFELISPSGASEKVHYRPNGEHPVLIRDFLEPKPNRLRVVVWSGPVYRVYLFFIRIPAGSATRYDLYWLTPSPRGATSPYRLEPAVMP